jgi:hypothetical protein
MIPGLRIPTLCLLGWLLIVGGLLGTTYFTAMFDISVRAPAISREALGIERVNNVGRMNDRQTGVIISLATLSIGVALAIVFRIRAQAPSPGSLSTSDSPSPGELRHEMDDRLHPDAKVQWLRDCVAADLAGRPRPPRPG